MIAAPRCVRASALVWACFALAAIPQLARPCAAQAPPPADDVPADVGDDEEANPLEPGVVVQFVGRDGKEHRRLVEQIGLTSQDDPPDRRMPPGPFSATYRGQLRVQTPGRYRLRAFAAGTVEIELAGKLLLAAASREPAWLDAEAIELPFGHHAIEVCYRRADESVRLALFWQGPQFGLEPLADTWLFHEKAQAPSAVFDEGQRLVRALRCGACHALPGEAAPLPGPALDRLAGNLSRRWMVDWLAAGSDGLPSSSSAATALCRMPHFGFDRPAAEAIADYLLAASEKTPAPVQAPALRPPKEEIAKDKRDASTDDSPPQPPSAALGGTLFRSLGCLACHRAGELGTDGLSGGGDLSRIAEKRPAGFVARWLVDPAATNRDHRMPLFPLDPEEISHLAEYLQTLGQSATADAKASGVAPASPNVAHGRELVAQARCGACHALPASAPNEKANTHKIPLRAAALAGDGGQCLGQPDPRTHRPGYRLAAAQREAIRAFIAGIASGPSLLARRGEQILAERNCLACHARGHASGLGAQVASIVENDPALQDVAAALAPPSLAGVGDKLHEGALLASIEVSQPARQTWLRARMPRFSFAPDEKPLLVRHLVETDRMPDRPATEQPDDSAAAADTAVQAAGARLVTADGFGCTSCHAIGRWKPQKVALNAAGADLSELGGRVRRAWFDRWVRNPARIVPRMEMPSVQQPIRGVLDGNLDRQLAAVWHALERPDFTPPSPDALRVVRRANLPSIAERAVVLTDVIEVSGRKFVKPLVVGLANRHNVLVDLADNRLAAWWIGDAARERTRGKTWYWEAGGSQLLAVKKGEPTAPVGDILLVRGENSQEPQRAGQYCTEFDSIEHVADGVAMAHRLRFAEDCRELAVRIVQRFSALAAGGPRAGFRRRLEIESEADGLFEILALAGGATSGAERRSARLSGPLGELEVRLAEPANARFVDTARGAVVRVELSADRQKPAEGTPFRRAMIELDYLATTLPDQFAPLPMVDRSVTRAELAVVPGFEATRLPVTDQAMPTGLAWRPDGTLVVSSLEGRVWLGHDGDSDALEDRLEAFSDELAAPFGVAAAGEAVDVINKYGLLRLYDRDGDGRADRTELLASGWAHTADYHDWAVGLPRNEQGQYFVSLPCQQDRRSEAAAHLRGSVMRLAPRQPTDDDPRRFTIEPLAAGLRFPQGIALSPGGELFVTDNQGNYTPFNELNHIVAGARYGFINRLEQGREGLPPARLAAVEIPHPWTRSVNGICFLVPPREAERSGHALYGPLAGQLIGCEYDTRRLVRMSLERVGDDFQGAVYPLSIEPAAGAETFEGPLVCQVAPTGDIYIGNIRDSGWGAGANTGSIVRLRWRGDLPAGIAEVRVARGGFSIDFTMPVDPARGGDTARYSVTSFRRVATAAYGGPDEDRRAERVRSVRLSPDRRRATIELDELREGFVYEFHLRELAGGATFFPAEAYYTLRHRMP